MSVEIKLKFERQNHCHQRHRCHYHARQDRMSLVKFSLWTPKWLKTEKVTWSWPPKSTLIENGGSTRSHLFFIDFNNWRFAISPINLICLCQLYPLRRINMGNCKSNSPRKSRCWEQKGLCGLGEYPQQPTRKTVPRCLPDDLQKNTDRADLLSGVLACYILMLIREM